MDSDLRIFVVDDDPVILDVLSTLLGERWEVETFPSAEACLERTAVCLPQLFILDITLAGMDGLSLCRHFKDDWETQDIPAIFVSASDDMETRLSGYEAGGSDFIVKPFEPEELFHKVEVAARMAQQASAAHPACRVVFVTAYDEFAVAAFEQAAVDYLVKPVTPERLARTLQRLVADAPATASPWDAPLRELQALLGQLPATAPASAAQALRWLRVGSEQAVQLLDVQTVDFFRAADKYTEAWSGGRCALVRLALGELETQLDPDLFWRIHRSVVVRVDAIHEARRDLMGRLFVHLHSGGEALPVSRSHMHLFNRS